MAQERKSTRIPVGKNRPVQADPASGVCSIEDSTGSYERQAGTRS